MADTDLPQLYLVTPPQVELSTFPDQLARTLDAVEIACLRLELATRDEDAIARAADACREVAHARDVAFVITDHVLMVERLGLDGVHFTDGARHVRKTRKDLGKDAIVGAFCAASRHDGLTAGEQGADYVSFGPVGTTGLGDGTAAERELFDWWSQMIEVPVVAEGALTEAVVRDFSPVTDFFSLGEEIWTAEDPVAALTALAAARH
ncbi:thiamine phosphate synthase [Maritimibacter sp. UBA3975]|uniref:thiamine phosphate synthase n=1 Tax=Maritimibacter sp. UBA3975 TaxID=1946833 RepID=UPI000C0B4A88|nr:thiamine phosphate synthase [Maritimibacter sp. UBA3975]MAM61265.1 thiamine phosphate synthase [Maritimibacter sp.]|tara:strand:+ start:1197 stop:1817 length:621 start_codon:yes stop_codon:yes gene_type:complete